MQALSALKHGAPWVLSQRVVRPASSPVPVRLRDSPGLRWVRPVEPRRWVLFCLSQS
jgi:hypothetical protein